MIKAGVKRERVKTPEGASRSMIRRIVECDASSGEAVSLLSKRVKRLVNQTIRYRRL